MPSPQWLFLELGRFKNGHASVAICISARCSSRRILGLRSGGKPSSSQRRFQNVILRCASRFIRSAQAIVKRHMVPAPHEISRIEADLTQRAEAVGGIGWGCMQVDRKDEEAEL